MTDAVSTADLASAAWRVRGNARVLGNTQVGAAVLADNGNVYTGCNVEHKFRSHDVHAEVNALTSMVADGGTSAVAIVIVSRRDHFTPCGACMDWIFELGGPGCKVYIANREDSISSQHLAAALMPYYPY